MRASTRRMVGACQVVELSTVTPPADNDRLSQLLSSLGVFLCLALCCFLSMVLFFWL